MLTLPGFWGWMGFWEGTMELPNLTTQERAVGVAAANLVLLRFLVSTMLETKQIDLGRLHELVEATAEGPPRLMLQTFLQPFLEGGDIFGKPN